MAPPGCAAQLAPGRADAGRRTLSPQIAIAGTRVRGNPGYRLMP